ncbi:hypothetical protein AAMO2058_001320000 [Amorphochlora amoebiformis]
MSAHPKELKELHELRKAYSLLSSSLDFYRSETARLAHLRLEKKVLIAKDMRLKAKEKELNGRIKICQQWELNLLKCANSAQRVQKKVRKTFAGEEMRESPTVCKKIEIGASSVTEIAKRFAQVGQEYVQAMKELFYERTRMGGTNLKLRKCDENELTWNASSVEFLRNMFRIFKMEFRQTTSRCYVSDVCRDSIIRGLKSDYWMIYQNIDIFRQKFRFDEVFWTASTGISQPVLFIEDTSSFPNLHSKQTKVLLLSCEIGRLFWHFHLESGQMNTYRLQAPTPLAQSRHLKQTQYRKYVHVSYCRFPGLIIENQTDTLNLVLPNMGEGKVEWDFFVDAGEKVVHETNEAKTKEKEMKTGVKGIPVASPLATIQEEPAMRVNAHARQI